MVRKWCSDVVLTNGQRDTEVWKEALPQTLQECVLPADFSQFGQGDPQML